MKAAALMGLYALSLAGSAAHTDTLALAGTKSGMGLWSVVKSMATLQFLWVIMGLSLLLLIVGALVWFFERDDTEGDEEESDWRGEDGRTGGVANGFWWAGVTMTTIGYGDLVPKSLPGRTVAMLWMLVSMAITASLTAYIVSSSGGPGGSGDLADAASGKRVGVVAGSPAVGPVAAVGGTVVRFDTLKQALAAREDGRVDLVAAGKAAFSSADHWSIQATAVQLPLQVAAKAEAADFVAELNRLTAAPSWWSQAAKATGE